MEPKTFRLIWRDGEYYVSEPNIDTCDVVRIDDPAIVSALSIAKAAREAGLVDGDRLRRIVGTPVLSADGCILLDGGTVWRSRYDTEDDEHYVQQFQTRIATNFYSWSIDSKRDFVDKSLAYAMRDTREAAERAAGGGA